MAVPRRREETKRLALPGGGDKTIAVSRGKGTKRWLPPGRGGGEAMTVPRRMEGKNDRGYLPSARTV